VAVGLYRPSFHHANRKSQAYKFGDLLREPLGDHNHSTATLVDFSEIDEDEFSRKGQNITLPLDRIFGGN